MPPLPLSHRRLTTAVAALAVTALTVPLAAAVTPAATASSRAGAPAASRVPYAAPNPTGITVKVITLHFKTVVDQVNGSPGQVCDVIGDLYIPSDASPSHPVPAILTTNGFGGSKNDQAFIGEQFGRRGYVVLSYSGLGFGGSQCKIQLDSPAWDGEAGTDLVEFLGGRPGVAFYDQAHTQPFPVFRDVISDTPRTHLPYDPRVGMIGGSYGGEIQFATAAVSQRVDAIVPIITWNNLAYSLAPNDTSFQRTPQNPASVSYTTPGTEKFDWTSLFFGVGIEDGLQGFADQPSRDVGCPNFNDQACVAKAQMDALGYPSAATVAFAQQASVDSYINLIHTPTLLMQGQADTLFNLQESVATYEALRARGVPAQLVWQSWGHSNSTPAKGELSTSITGDPLSTYEGRLIAAWFDKWLKHDPRAYTGASFQYYEAWQPSPTSGPDYAQYASASSFPAGTLETLHLSGTDQLVPARAPVAFGSAAFVVPGGQTPTSYTETSALQGNAIPDQATPVTDLPGTAVSFTSPPLTRAAVQVGSPELTLHLTAPSFAATQRLNPASELLIFVRLEDVAPNGTVTLVHRLIAPVRISNVTAAVHIELPAIVHRYPAGDRLVLVVAAGDAAYKNDVTGGLVRIVNNPAAPSTLQVPFLAGQGAQFPASASGF